MTLPDNAVDECAECDAFDTLAAKARALFDHSAVTDVRVLRARHQSAGLCTRAEGRPLGPWLRGGG
ncbi:hypothetical protein C7C46_18370 [Streptomyces tateyamensis]|uniref:Uncharacterized protein n=1 Tax=Streptomyces tateyamensis TaxID=565073 RepID=A0A2V4N1E5_9ACTN|nr:hypothetical protein [Streptomyces tateyamensis]PYC77599.1 hypothetical protein C7C46_18370 [Streptomyces tateyamensis]